MRAEPGSAAVGLVVTNLLNELTALGTLLERAASEQWWLDAYLVAAGINQIAEDHLHDAPYPLDDAASLLAGSGSRAGRLAGRAAGVSALAARRIAARSDGFKRTHDWQRQVAVLVDALADVVVAGGAQAARALANRCRRLSLEIPTLPLALRQAVLRLPACFHDFDQRPEDLARLVERFTERSADRDRPLLVAGVRTSGSYLAPLIAAVLRARGRDDTRVLTLRPGRALLEEEAALVRGIARGGQVLITDDPPVTGSSLAAGCAQIERLGVARASVVLLLALQGESAAPAPVLAAYRAVVLTEDQWSVRSRLRPEAARSELQALLDGELEIEAVERMRLPSAGEERRHHRALFSVRGRDAIDGTAREFSVLASGVGLGYFGAHHLGVARTLQTFAPRVLGLRDGLLYRVWLPAECRMPAECDELPASVAAYVATRQRALRVSRDTTVTMIGQRPVWEVAGLLLGAGFGRAAPLARVALVDRAMRRLLRVTEPSVVDGSTAPEHWFMPPGDGVPAVKVSLSDRTYWSLGLACCDATFDLAGVGPFTSDGTLAERVRTAWLRETGNEVDPERWLLYELAHLWGRLRADPTQESMVRHASARALQRYFAGAFLANIDRVAARGLCALDVDGVLESEHLGFPTLTRASATALRALIAHGYVPVPVTGRGLEEVRERCRAYGVAAGVAEYGSALCLDGGERTVTLVGPDGDDAVRRVRAALQERDGVRLDPAYVHAVRAYRMGSDGRRRPLEAAELTECLQAAGVAGAIEAIQGDNQTDLVASGVDKGAGLRALLDALAGSGDGRAEVALAVGDTAADAPMLALARSAFVPAHATPEAMVAGAKRVRRPYQAGLALAVAELLGHRPGSCARCRVGQQTTERELLLDLLSISEDGLRGLTLQTIKLGAGLR
jgi:hydroxymethylpyrimidine pyrophosphatase-like HAD family hydrolase/adenine/guanine phosphoribosyltransferase-like PRPP-binding protein